LFDWDSMVLSGLWEEEGRRDVLSEMQMYSQLGLIEEDETKENRRDEALRGGTSNLDESDHIDLGDHNIDQPCEDYLPDEKIVKYDKINPSMQPDNLFPNMKEFRIAMRQYAIKHEFELGIDVIGLLDMLAIAKVVIALRGSMYGRKRKDYRPLWYVISFF
jgi:hypothetical protein